MNILFPSLLSDYLTAVEFKDATFALSTSQALGGIAGGIATALLSWAWGTEAVLMAVAGGSVVAWFLPHRIEKRLPRLPSTTESDSGNSTRSGWETFRILSVRYPIFPFLAGGSFLFIVLYCIAEYGYFTVYAAAFADDRSLTIFLGLARSGSQTPC